MSIHAVSMGNFIGSIELNPDLSDCCPGCGGIKSRRAKQCRQCTNERIGRERVARGKIPGQMARFMAAHRARQAAGAAIDAAIDAAVADFDKEVGRAVEASR